jgi:predicted ATPase/DNA-binding CsgD family transcriptional regulator
MVQVNELLADHRLLTLTGSGGSGKTRLALAVAAEMVEDYEDGIWLVELAPLSDPELVVQAVASVLGVREQPGRPLVGTLAEALRDKKMLLLLDNCEHLIGASAELAGTLLRSCPNLRILATSREAFGMTGEVVFAVLPLSLPDPRRLPTTESLPSYEAARLFVERAAAVEPAFQVTEQNAMAIAQVCYRLDGMPLAIELAAARVRVLSVEQISSRLDNRFGLLTGGGRTALPRQRTLRAAMDWGHELLEEGERILFRRLSVFAGGFTLEAAEAVCAGEDLGEDLERSEVLDLLASLVDKSLVMVAEHSGEARYSLLETLRQYGQQKLDESGEEPAMRRHHAEYYLTLAEEAEPELAGPHQVVWLERLEIEHANLRAALRWLLDPEGARSEEGGELGLRLTVALWLFWNIYGSSEGHRWVETALARTSIRSAARAKALNGAGWMALWQGDYEKGMSLLEEGLALFKELGDDQSAAVSLAYLGLAVLRQADDARINSLCEQAEALLREPLDRRTSAELLFFLAPAAAHKGDYGRSVSLFEESLAVFRELGDTRGMTRCVTSMGVWAVVYGDYERAAPLLEEGLRSLRGLKDQPGIAFSLLGLAGIAAHHGEYARAARLWGAAESLREAIELPLAYHELVSYGYEDRVGGARGRLGEEAFAGEWAEGRAMSPEEAIEYALQPPETPQEPASVLSYPAGLSPREVEILKLVAKGMTNAKIAEELFLSPRTVNAHLRSVYHKIGFHSRAEAARFASEHNLL